MSADALTLPEQLGFAPGMRYALHALPDAVTPLFAVLPDGMQLASTELDIAVLFVSDSAMLTERWADLAPMLQPTTRVWLCRPKPGVLRCDLDETRMAEMMAARGFEPQEQLVVDAVWTALRVTPVRRT
ncbi:MAG TPA: hypothetical protein VLC08_06685 [Chitinolyticbacter sp.]|nr:hypothetical protein [Chitinolyticbacter sp.]